MAAKKKVVKNYKEKKKKAIKERHIKSSKPSEGRIKGVVYYDKKKDSFF